MWPSKESMGFYRRRIALEFCSKCIGVVCLNMSISYLLEDGIGTHHNSTTCQARVSSRATATINDKLRDARVRRGQSLRPGFPDMTVNVCVKPHQQAGSAICLASWHVQMGRSSCVDGRTGHEYCHTCRKAPFGSFAFIHFMRVWSHAVEPVLGDHSFMIF